MITSPVASVLAWQLAAGTGLSTTTMRVGPALLAQLPWPAGDLAAATAALTGGDVEGCARERHRRVRDRRARCRAAAGVVAVAAAVARR